MKWLEERRKRKQDERFRQMNADADRAVHEVIHTITSNIGVDELENMLNIAKDKQEKYVTLATLLADQMRKSYPEWRKKV
jgi:phage shock protein A